MIKLIIFDYDGVIVDSFKTVYEVYKIICQKLGVKKPKNIEVFRNIYGYNLIECQENLGIAPANFKKAGKIFEEEVVKKNPKLFNGMNCPTASGWGFRLDCNGLLFKIVLIVQNLCVQFLFPDSLYIS